MISARQWLSLELLILYFTCQNRTEARVIKAQFGTSWLSVRSPRENRLGMEPGSTPNRLIILPVVIPIFAELKETAAQSKHSLNMRSFIA
jgi:hypothetical protein